jgi:CheY-like chemotaxis protein
MEPQRQRVLVVEDDHVAATVYSQVLELAGYAVETAGDGAAALQAIERSRPDLVVLDIILPIMDGWVFLDRIRQMSDAPPVVAVSASGEVARALQVGASAAFTKPFALHDLVTTCTRILDRAAR